MDTRIKEVMTSKGFTNVSLGEKMGVSKQAVGQMLKAESLTTASLEKIAVALGVPIWQLLLRPRRSTHLRRPTQTLQPSSVIMAYTTRLTPWKSLILL